MLERAQCQTEAQIWGKARKVLQEGIDVTLPWRVRESILEEVILDLRSKGIESN